MSTTHPTAQAANQAAIAEILAALDAQKNAIGGTLLKFTKTHYAACPIVKNLYKNNGEKTGQVVQVEGEFTNTNPASTTKVWIVLDVDVPPAGSTQEPHIGWELHVDGKRLANGHCWVAPGVLKVGRPGTEDTHLLKRFEVAEMGAEEVVPGEGKLVFRPAFLRLPF